MVCQCAIFVFLDCPYNPPFRPPLTLKPPFSNPLSLDSWLVKWWIVDRRHIISCDECDKNFASTFRNNFSSGFYPRVLAGCIFFIKIIPVPQGLQYLSFHDPTHTHMETKCTSQILGHQTLKASPVQYLKIQRTTRFWVLFALSLPTKDWRD